MQRIGIVLLLLFVPLYCVVYGDESSISVNEKKVYQTKIGYEPIYKDTFTWVPDKKEKNGSITKGYYNSTPTLIGYNQVVSKSVGRNDYIGLEVDGIYYDSVVKQEEGYYAYLEKDKKYFCEDCRCRKYEEKMGLCWKVDLKGEEQKIDDIFT